ncbi:MAG: fatty acid desaturase family protein [Bryobacteraceae bacterium]
MHELFDHDTATGFATRRASALKFKPLTVVSDRSAIMKAAAIAAGLVLGLLLARLALAGASIGIPEVALLIGAILASVWTQHAIAEEIHDGVHFRVLSNARRNDLLCSVYASMIGVEFLNFRRDHSLHHRFFGSPRDPDYVKYVQAPRGLGGWVRYLGLYFSGLAAVQRLIDRRPSEEPKAAPVGFLKQHPHGTAVAQLCLLGIGAVLVHPVWYFICWIGPLLTITYGITQLRTMLEHWSGEDWIDPKTGERRTGALFNLQGGLQRNLFAAQFGYNYHGSHHILPAIPNTNLERTAEEMRDYPFEGSLPIRTMTYAARIKDVIRRSVAT